MQNGQPSCFGKHWDPNNVECRGGNDPSYSHPKTGSNRRDMCRWYSACAAATNQGRTGQAVNIPVPPPPVPQSAFVPITNVVRPPSITTVPTPTPISPPVPIGSPQLPHAQPTQLAPQQHVAYMSGLPYTQPQFASQPILVPVNQPMPGTQVHSFLTVPEPYNPNVPMGTRLWRTVYRSMFKAAFVGAANFIDYNPLTPPR